MKRIVSACLLASALRLSAWQPTPSTLMTTWGEKVTSENVWRSYPRPRLVRSDWTNLNGLWKYAVTPNAVATKGMPSSWDGEILVPFALETPLSGVGRLLKPDELLWYRRTINGDHAKDERIILHFGAVDFRAQVFVGHREVTDLPHEGHQVPFEIDITDAVQPGENELTVCVWDPTVEWIGCLGKQVLNPGGIFYTRMSGIWQTVWTERVPAARVTDYSVKADLQAGTLAVTVVGCESAASRKGNWRGKARLLFKGALVGEGEFVFGAPVLFKPKGGLKAWTPENPNLYDIELEYGADRVKGYCAARTFEKRADVNGVLRFYLNGEPYFIQGPLDQGWWPDGFLTPPSEEAMRFDIETLKKMGLNMMRKHLKVEPAQYYRLCDELGMMVVQDMGYGRGDKNQRYGFYRKELKDMVDALKSYPSIVMWTPYNEGGGQPGEFLTHCTLDWVRNYDPERLVDGPSGWTDFENRPHRPEGVCEAADTVDIHSYRGPGMPKLNPRRVAFLGEFGGLGHRVEGHLWKPDAKGSWGYGGFEDTATREGLQNVYLGLMESLAGFASRGLGGSVYTQTTDVEREINGYLTYDRKVLKFDADVLRKAHERVFAEAVHAAKTPLKYVTVLPRYNTWRYRFDDAPAGWEKPGFDDSAWAVGKAGFGSRGIGDRPEADGKTQTVWDTKKIFIRKTFEYNPPKGVKPRAVYIDMRHDDVATVYLNGEEILYRKGFIAVYNSFPAAPKALKLLKPGRNEIAISVTQEKFSQYIDAELVLQCE